jgi:pimeloyl-ACP methyl ester carboxylesterase
MKKSVCYQGENIISYAEYGDKTGYPILINHGLIASITDSYLFDQLIRLGAYLVCMARPGYGDSSPYRMHNMAEWGDIVSVLVEELGIPQFDVLGMSSGAPYSYAIGYRLPDRARNLYIFSGIPALYDEEVLSLWPYEVNRNASIPELERLAHELFFSNVSEEDLERDDIKESMRNDCFGLAQDLRLRSLDWGFRLSDVKQNVHMRHSRFDPGVPFVTALRTSKLLPNCQLEVKETDEHFSKEGLDDFIKVVIAGNYES